MEWLQPVGIVLLIGVCVALMWAAVKDGKPLRRVASAGAQGLGGLLLVNATAGLSGVSLGFSWMALGGSVLLGLPGVITLVLLRLILSVFS